MSLSRNNLILLNPNGENADGGRLTKIVFTGFSVNATSTDLTDYFNDVTDNSSTFIPGELSKIEVSQDGNSNNFNGKMIISVNSNTNSNDTTFTETITIYSNNQVRLGGSLNTPSGKTGPITLLDTSNNVLI